MECVVVTVVRRMDDILRCLYGGSFMIGRYKEFFWFFCDV